MGHQPEKREIGFRIDLRAIDDHLEVQVRAGRAPG
jgi:hypothetical protein